MNKVPKDWAEKEAYGQLVHNTDPNNPDFDIMPRKWAFEISTVIYDTDILFFSKIKEKVWPDAGAVVARLQNFVDDTKTMTGARLKAKYQKGEVEPTDAETEFRVKKAGNRVATMKAKWLIEVLIEEYVEEELERLIERRYPGIRTVLDEVSKKAPDMFVDVLVDEYVEKKVEEMKKCIVPYERLTIKSNANRASIFGDCTVEHLFDKSKVSQIAKQGISVFCSYPPEEKKHIAFEFENKKQHLEIVETDNLTVTIKVQDGYPDLILTDYAIKTANDCPDADPKTWFFTHGPRVENDEADRIHEEEEYNFGPGRW